LFVVDTAAGEDAPSDLRVFINPEILSTDEEVIFEEGCLSFPGVREDVRRFERCRVRAFDEHGKQFELEAEGLLAIAIQHETDHLDGKLMIDRLSLLRKRIVHKSMAKRAADEAPIG
ncbi:MAG: peptide deformylase, partial [Polyangiaceae bacterium]|nr:peptide deformylase [Polyangiaceae bacterium]